MLYYKLWIEYFKALENNDIRGNISHVFKLQHVLENGPNYFAEAILTSTHNIRLWLEMKISFPIYKNTFYGVLIEEEKKSTTTKNNEYHWYKILLAKLLKPLKMYDFVPDGEGTCKTAICLNI